VIADRLGHRAELPQEPELVPGGPDLDDLPLGDPFDRDSDLGREWFEALATTRLALAPACEVRA
jgi:hypothetical protein